MLNAEYAYVAAPQVNVRDRLSTVYNKVAVVKNGERVEILEKQKRFARVRTSGGQEGWLELRHLVGPEIYDGFDKLAKENLNAPAQAQGATRFELNMHLTPGRDSEHLYQLQGNEKVQVLKRAVAEKTSSTPAPKPAPKPGSPPTQTAGKSEAKAAVVTQAAAAKKPKKEDEKPPVLEDWYLVRNAQNRVGWVLARMIDIDVPLEIAQYAEGQRIIAAPVLNTVRDAELGKDVPQYLVLASEPKDGMPYDFNQIRIFSWNVKRHRYETAYRERGLVGLLPVRVGREDFDKEGNLPMFVIRVQGDNGQVFEKKYKMNGPIVRRVLAPGEQPASASTARRTAPAKPKPLRARKHR